MKIRSPRLVAAVTFAVLLGTGAALVKQTAQRGEAQRRLEAGEVAARVAAALEREIEDTFEQLGALRSGQVAGIRRARVESVLMVADGRVVAAVPQRPVSIAAEDLPAFEGADPGVVGPLRGAGGAQKMVLRLPVRSRDSAQASLVAVMDLNELVRSTILPRIQGYDYLLASAGARAASISRSSDAALPDAVGRVLRVGSDRWSLTLAPRAGWSPWPALMLNAIMVLVVALACSLVVYDLAEERGVLRQALDKQRDRLRAANRRIVEEVQQREVLEKQFSRASFHDSLTGLANRRLLESRLEQGLKAIRTAARGELAFASLELDRIKAVSDSFGPSVADELLVQAARRFEASVGGSEIAVGRIGDAAFGLVLPSAHTREAALAAIDRAHLTLDEPFDVAGQRLFVTAHVGVAFSQSGYDHADDLMRGAHIALSTARRERLPRALFDPSTQEQVISRHQLETDLHHVDERDELRIAFQPVVSLATGEIAGMEALVRWQHPVEGLLSPGRFIALAEETGLITPITRWMLRQAILQAAAWRRDHPDRSIYVSVNLSAHDMRDAAIGDFVQGVLEESRLPRGTLRLEVTESSMIDNLRAAVDLLARFRAMGVPILLDDFGTGYSSLSYLHRFQIDYLKIDQSFVSRMTPDPRSSSVVRAILSLAEGMGISTVAEGIETAETAQVLRELKCAFGQGYHYSRPVDAAGADLLLAKRRLRAP